MCSTPWEEALWSCCSPDICREWYEQSKGERLVKGCLILRIKTWITKPYSGIAYRSCFTRTRKEPSHQQSISSNYPRGAEEGRFRSNSGSLYAHPVDIGHGAPFSRQRSFDHVVLLISAASEYSSAVEGVADGQRELVIGSPCPIYMKPLYHL